MYLDKYKLFGLWYAVRTLDDKAYNYNLTSVHLDAWSWQIEEEQGYDSALTVWLKGVARALRELEVEIDNKITPIPQDEYEAMWEGPVCPWCGDRPGDLNSPCHVCERLGADPAYPPA